MTSYWLCPLFELGGEAAYIDEVGGERRVVVGEVPLPAGAALVVVAEHPTQTAHVLQGHAVPAGGTSRCGFRIEYTLLYNKKILCTMGGLNAKSNLFQVTLDRHVHRK